VINHNNFVKKSAIFLLNFSIEKAYLGLNYFDINFICRKVIFECENRSFGQCIFHQKIAEKKVH